MIKFVLSIPRYLASSQLKAIQSLKINRQSFEPLELQQKLRELVQKVDKEDFPQFIEASKEFEFAQKEIAELYNKQLDASQLIIQRHCKVEAIHILNSAYQYILKMDPSIIFQADFDIDSYEQYLNDDGIQTILSQTQKNTLSRAYHKIIESTFYGRYYETTRGLSNDITMIEIIKTLEQQILVETEIPNLLWRTFLFTFIQSSNKRVIQHFSQIIGKASILSNKELILIMYILERFSENFGNNQIITTITKKVNYMILQEKDKLEFIDRICILIKCSKEFDIQNKQVALCQPVYENIREVPTTLYPQVFNSLCNHYWMSMKLIDEEEFIANNLEQFNNPYDLVQILLGFLYAESENTKLMKILLGKLAGITHISSAVKCCFYQILVVLEKIYNIEFEVEVERKESLKSTYFNGTNLSSSPAFSNVNLELLEILQKISDELNSHKRSDWKITKIKKEAIVGIYKVDFIIELEGIYRKKLIYLDFMQRCAFIQNEFLIGKQRLRRKMLKNENVIFIDYKDWYSAQDKYQFVKKILDI